VSLKLGGALFHCGRCRKSYSNPFGHVCVERLDRAPRTGRTRLAPKITASAGKCPQCGKPRGNPLTHTCTTRTDFKKRQAAAKKAARAKKPARPVHLYETCQDEECKRIPCLAYREGRQEGYEEGHQDGYGEGFPDGMAACPRKHT
jgi:hypothetical protein